MCFFHLPSTTVVLSQNLQIAVYNDPVDGSSLKRKANGHVDDPAPKKANTNTFVPRVPGERYQGTAARLPSTSRPVLKRKPMTQQGARNNNAGNIDNLASSSGKSKSVQQQRPKDATAMDLDTSSSVGKKRDAEKGLNERPTKKQKANPLPSSNLAMTQSSQAAKAAPSGVISVKPTPKSSFFKSLYPEGSKLKASVGVGTSHAAGNQRLISIKRSVVSTEVVSTAVPPTAVRTRYVKHITREKTISVIGEPRSHIPRGKDNKISPAANHTMSEKLLKRKDRASEEGTERKGAKKIRKDDGSWSAKPSVEKTPMSSKYRSRD